jgi:tetratricopeptide (TPR) repeat protein
MCAAIVWSSLAALACAQSAQESFAKGKARLAKADFSAALNAFAAAAREDRGNQEYVQHHAMVRRIIALRKRFESEQDPQQWEYLARALRAFYASERIYPELLAIDQKIHARLNTAESALMLAETQLSLEENAAAVKTLSVLPSGQRDTSVLALLGIALARSGKKDAAKQIADELALPQSAGPGIVYAVARLHAAAGDSAKALGLLKTCFESVPASRQAGFQAHAKNCPEFAAMASTAEFTAALATASKVAESKCSGGSSCAGCPMSGKCPKSQGQKQ